MIHICPDPIMTTALNGYCAKLTGAALDAVRSDPNVDYLSEESFMSIDYETIRSPANGPVGPAGRTLVDRSFIHPTAPYGNNVDIYVFGETPPYPA
jgi:hypothetical protein